MSTYETSRNKTIKSFNPIRPINKATITDSTIFYTWPTIWDWSIRNGHCRLINLSSLLKPIWSDSEQSRFELTPWIKLTFFHTIFCQINQNCHTMVCLKFSRVRCNFSELVENLAGWNFKIQPQTSFDFNRPKKYHGTIPFHP